MVYVIQVLLTACEQDQDGTVILNRWVHSCLTMSSVFRRGFGEKERDREREREREKRAKFQFRRK